MSGVKGPRPPIGGGLGPFTPLAGRVGSGESGYRSGCGSGEDGVPEREGGGVLRVKAVFDPHWEA
jgi:hypothetical protein